MFDAHQRGLAMGVFAAAPFLGPAIGPVVSPFVHIPQGHHVKWAYCRLAASCPKAHHGTGWRPSSLFCPSS
jgi:MFS family permease